MRKIRTLQVIPGLKTMPAPIFPLLLLITLCIPVNGTKVFANVQSNQTQISKTELSKAYSTAINQYLQSNYSTDKSKIDTLFINKRKNNQPDDFPDIELPKSINGAKIIMLSAEEAKEKQRYFRKSSPLVNIIGWIDDDKREFIFVTFFPEFKHRSDCYINYTYNPKTKEFDLLNSRIEVLKK